jgi:hypothetical protein
MNNNLFNRLLIAGALLLPNVALAQNEFANDDSDSSAYRTCVAKYCFDDEGLVELTPAEQERLDHLKARMARIIADAGERKEVKAKEEAKREAIRRSQCAIPFLWIGCPTREGS